MMIDFIRSIITHLFGAVFVVAICGFIYKRHAKEWESLAMVYGRRWARPIAVKKRRSMVLYAKDEPARTYSGIVTIGVYADGIGLKPIRWLAPFHSPVFIPFEDIKGWQQRWYWDGKSVELSFEETQDLRIIMPASQIAWISSQGTANIDISPERPATGNWPYATFFSAVFMALLMVTFFIALYLKADGDWLEMWSLLGRGNKGGQ